MDDTQQYSSYIDTAIRAAREAGRIQKSRLGSEIGIRHKGESDLVTEVDVACEETIKRIIASDWPEHSVLGEESGATGKSDLIWIIDPLDGTTNYAHSYPHFCSSVALEAKGKIVAGVVYDPMRDELFSAIRGGGAYLNGKRIKVSSCAKLETSMLSTGFPYDAERRVKTAIPMFVAIQNIVQAIRRDGAAALNMCYTACGRFDGFWEISLHAWDVAAAWLMIEEAGGKVTGIDGKPTNIYSEQILATNGLLHDALAAALSSQV